MKRANIPPRIGIDLLGSDLDPKFLLQSILSELIALSSKIHLTLFGTEELFLNIKLPSQIQKLVVTEFIAMDEDPLLAVRRKKKSSLAIGMQMLKQFELDAFVTAGNTGALIATAKLHVPMLPGIDRPALMTLIPTKKKPVAVIDVGANVQVTASQFLQFAKMGIAYQKVREIPQPKVGLLNIGSERKKGTIELQKAYRELDSLNKQSPLDAPIFLGNVEGRTIFNGDIDVLVTDGFTGNIFLKTAEGIAAFIAEQLGQLKWGHDYPELQNLVKHLQERLQYEQYPGAIVSGIDGIAMKCHGSSARLSLISSIKAAERLINHFFIEKIKIELNDL